MNQRVFDYFGLSRDDPRWSDWTWQYQNRITDIEQLSHIITLSAGEKSDIATCLKRFRMAITPYFATLIDPDDPDCPIRLQTVPRIAETVSLPCEMADPLNEDGDSPVPNIVHRYPDRVLFLVTRACAAYCRHCTRRRIVGEEDYAISRQEIDTAIGYIERTERVRDVLISGGDPLTLSDRSLEYIIARIRAIPHVDIIRIGTRIPITMPMRITPALTRMLRQYHPLWINIQCNHPRELTPEAAASLAALADAGIPLGNQSVLLRGVNDSVETMRELVLRLVRARVRPYYIYQCDLSEGLGQFRTRVETGIDIIRGLTGNITGFAVPKFVIDAPGGGGKVPINPEYIVSHSADKIVMRNFEGRIYEYPEPADLAPR